MREFEEERVLFRSFDEEDLKGSEKQNVEDCWLPSTLGEIHSRVWDGNLKKDIIASP